MSSKKKKDGKEIKESKEKTSSTQKKPLKKKNSSISTSSNNSNSNINSGNPFYGIEKSLQLYRNNILQLTNYLNTLNYSKFVEYINEINSNSIQITIESSVVVDLLYSIGICYGRYQNRWNYVLKWFELFFKLNSFLFIKMLFTKTEKDNLLTILNEYKEYYKSNNGNSNDNEINENNDSLSQEERESRLLIIMKGYDLI